MLTVQYKAPRPHGVSLVVEVPLVVPFLLFFLSVTAACLDTTKAPIGRFSLSTVAMEQSTKERASIFALYFCSS
ncbi:MAG: hypothetical protein J3R72DRAFT_457983 [Linnemannia gamsii]|nr:MAG: hypothetical protein J3R72DRAFT_457983 [Linnemannia gamsii]